MAVVVGVRFKRAGKIYFFDPGNLLLTPKEKVIVETARGIEFGEVVIGPREVLDDALVQPLKTVLRIGTEEDTEQVAANIEKQKEAFKICLEKIHSHALPMKLIDVEYTFDRSRIIFYFTAEGRVDFRELVKSLASVFRTRIELRQIGVRDEAKMLGGMGSCGRVLCCHAFLGDFEPVSIRMAKDQNLSLNPTKISGICGRLMCCLKYECAVYANQKEGRAKQEAGSGEKGTRPPAKEANPPNEGKKTEGDAWVKDGPSGTLGLSPLQDNQDAKGDSKSNPKGTQGPRPKTGNTGFFKRPRARRSSALSDRAKVAHKQPVVQKAEQTHARREAPKNRPESKSQPGRP